MKETPIRISPAIEKNHRDLHDKNNKSLSKNMRKNRKTDNTIEIFNIQETMIRNNKNLEVIIDNSPSKKLDETSSGLILVPSPALETNINLNSIQRNFIRKVLVILSCQFFASMLMVSSAIFINIFTDFILNHLYLVLVAFFMEITFFISLICCRPFWKKVPHNYIILFLFTFSTSYILCFMCVIVSKMAVLIASISTACLVIGISIFSVCTERDLTAKIALIIYLPIAGLLIVVFASAFPVYITQLFVSLFIVMIFGIYLVYDIQKLKGKFEDAYSIDDYIIAALEIYVDVVFIFKELLIVIGTFFAK